MTKHILTKAQREQNLDVVEMEHFLTLFDTVNSKTVAVFSTSGATIAEIQRTADDYLVNKLYSESLKNGGFRNG